jgi:2-oxoglutarate ferredoxin oxidoreductase subunit delta
MQKKTKYAINQTDENGTRPGRQGHVIVIEDRCKGCGFCIANCPRQVLSFSSVFNAKGYHLPKAVDATKCVNCHFCEILCPDFAIYSVALSDLND